ncbi:alpha/beta hydrolase [Aestuariivivens sediminis]|uniref:alpha/beta hydrolase n=1 Tax=Aestuariivivens sediminis TaxID=2913557 RepID=UPI001F584456|nr:alpha/beta hydrolase family protein [Aestuariivivens sediminis]
MKIKLVLFAMLCNCFHLMASQVDTLTVMSQSMNKPIKNVVIFPDSYASQEDEFPVLYLLHGAGDDFSKWVTTVPNIKNIADTYNMIIVCPDGAVTGWYFDSPIDSTMKYETYIYKELVTTIDNKYNTIKEKTGRAITGISMGGHGALYLAFRHQDIWGAAGSMSGGVDIRPFPNNWNLSERLGKYSENKEVWESHTVINLLHLLDGDLKLIIDCGHDDFFFDANQRLHKKLIERNIAHDFIERPGKHNWTYWTNAIKYQTLFFNDYFQKNRSM